MTTETTTTVARREPTAGSMVKDYRDSFAAVVPSHVNTDSWIRIAQGALKKGKKVRDGNGRSVTELELAATNNPAAFLSSLLDAARLGLEPGTEEYYLTPRKVKGQLEILGIVGYQGYVELMFRAGAISSVVAECVYANDKFQYRPGRDPIPLHDIDWDLDDRGDLRLVYSYALMKGGGYSKVIVLNRASIMKIKAKSQGSNGEYSPWQTNEPDMWLKSSIRQLRKWVPTSREHMREMIRAERDVAAEVSTPQTQSQGPRIDVTDLPVASDVDDGIEDAELVDPAENADEYLDETAATWPDVKGSGAR